MLEFLLILLPTLASSLRSRRDLTLENLVLRHQLQVALRSRPHPHLKPWDRLFWPETRELIASMAQQNPLWGTERIRGELLKLGIVVSSRYIRRYRRRRQRPRSPSQSWRTFLANHAQVIWAADLFVVQTLTLQTLYVLFFIGHRRRQLLRFEVTAHPTAAWVWRQLIEATHDRDRVW